MSANKKWKPKLLPYQEQFLHLMDLVESAMVIPKQTLAKLAEKDALHFKPHGLCGSVEINITIFDQAVKDGYKLNLITGQYEKAPRRTRRSR